MVVDWMVLVACHLVAGTCLGLLLPRTYRVASDLFRVLLALIAQPQRTGLLKGRALIESMHGSVWCDVLGWCLAAFGMFSEPDCTIVCRCCKGQVSTTGIWRCRH